MKRKLVLGIMLPLLLISMLTLAFNIQPVRAEPKTWTVDDDGPADFSRIGDAIGSPSVMNGDTIFVYSGTYHERYLYVYKSLTIIGEDKSTTIIDGGGGGPIIELFHVTGANLSGFTIRNGSWDPWVVLGSGIVLHTAKSCSVSETIVSNSRYGITLYRSRGNTISGNTISNTETGIYLESSNNNTVSGNTISNSTLGIDPYWGGGMWVEGGQYNNFTYNTISNTTRWGIGLNHAHYNKVADNSVSDAQLGIFFDGDVPSYYNTVAGNSISNCSHSGIYFNYPYYNDVFDNAISDSTHGIHFEVGGSNNTVIGNTVTGSDEAIEISYADNNLVSGNTVSNSRFGIGLREHSNNNTVINNVVSNNYYGIVLFSSNNSKIYHNNIIDNTIQASVSESYDNIWDDGYPSGGNYWSDYTDVDLFSGPGQDESGSDGIWDHPYVIDSDNQDNYPLVHPWCSPTGHIYTLVRDIKSMELWERVEDSLVGLLQDAVEFLEKDREVPATITIFRFIFRVWIYRLIGILTEDQSSYLTKQAMEIIHLIWS